MSAKDWPGGPCKLYSLADGGGGPGRREEVHWASGALGPGPIPLTFSVNLANPLPIFEHSLQF